MPLPAPRPPASLQVLERVLCDISFSAPELAAESRRAGKESHEVVVDEALVRQCCGHLLKQQDLSKYVL